MRLLRYFAAVSAVAVMTAGCSLVPTPDLKPVPVVQTRVAQCPPAGTVQPSCPVDDKPSAEQLQGTRTIDAYQIIGTWAQNLIKCQGEVTQWRAAEDECEGVK